ncbi:hypothetical protein L195_g046048, partial [Trifolium pratense]
MVLPQRVPLPKPPDPENYVQGNGSLAKLPPSSQSPAADSGVESSPPPQATPAKMTSRSTEQIDLTSVEKNLGRRRAKKVIPMFGGILEKMRLKGTFGKLEIILNLKDWPSVIFNWKAQVERIVDVWPWMEIEEVLPKSSIWNSWTNDFAQQGMHGEFFKYFNDMKLLGQLHLKIFISLLSGCINQHVLQNVKNMHSYVLSTCDFRTGLICVARWITVPLPLRLRYIAAKNGETFANIVASRVTIGVSIRTITVAQKYNNGMSMFINSFSLIIKQPSMSLIEVFLPQNHFLRKDNMVKLQHLCSSAFELLEHANEGLFHLANVKTVVLNSLVRIIPWDPGKFNVFMAKVACECYWRNFLSIYCLLNWVFGRMNHFQPLPTGLNEESQLEPKPEEALDTRRNDQGEVEVLVK